jgi:branched-chain amino acid transport system ATP-binding protein
MSDILLEVNDLDAFYGDAQVLFSLSMRLRRAEMLALIGANGAGKSTFLKSIVGLVNSKGGEINYQGRSIAHRPAFEIVVEGIALVPEGRRLFPSLSVEENLLIGGKVRRPGIWNLDSIYELFPALKDKRRAPATLLSGGQQQMVAIGRALMSNPDLLLVDELSLGLAPIVIKDIYDLLPLITRTGLSLIIVEQDVTCALRVADRFTCMLEGRISLEGEPADFTRDQVTAAYFGT